MGLFRPFIQKELNVAPDGVQPSDRLFTPANVMTAARPLLALKAAGMLLRGERFVLPWVGLIAASDAEGNLARFIDKIAPNSGLGTSTPGAEYDPIADTTAILTISAAALFAPRMPVTGRVAIAAALGHEGFKAAWAIRKNNLYQEVADQRLYITPTLEGKESMAEKFGAVGLAIAASDFDNPYARNILGTAATAMAATGAVRGEGQRRIYDAVADQMIAETINTQEGR